VEILAIILLIATKRKLMTKRIEETEAIIKTETPNLHVIEDEIIEVIEMIEVRAEVEVDPETGIILEEIEVDLEKEVKKDGVQDQTVLLLLIIET
jgi:hypothetical protein